ncbi:MAG: glycosyltransferase family 9 protein [Gammaproteobacteria bacterium]|nr:glycosyltransferase family 9 protein [Gammaproteobacteria bacterium]
MKTPPTVPPTARFLVIRRDNIGDLVCTTPLVRALRRHYPDARICLLVNSYNRPVVENNPDIDAVYDYTKAKHRRPNQSLAGVYRERWRMMWRLRRERFDYAIIASNQERVMRLARFLRPRHIIGFTGTGARSGRHVDIGVPAATTRPLHEAENVFRLLGPLEIGGTPPPMFIQPDAEARAEAQRKVSERSAGRSGPLIGVHLSTRRSTNRWPVAHFIELIRRLHVAYPEARFLLLWAPGDSSNPRHPGDDDNAARIVKSLEGLPLIAYPMGPLDQLIADLSLCDTVITSDGGALHIAAALGKPIVCFFGDIDTSHWYPWGVPHVLLQPATRHAPDITVDDAFSACQRLWRMAHPNPTHPGVTQVTG